MGGIARGSTSVRTLAADMICYYDLGVLCSLNLHPEPASSDIRKCVPDPMLLLTSPRRILVVDSDGGSRFWSTSNDCDIFLIRRRRALIGRQKSYDIAKSRNKAPRTSLILQYPALGPGLLLQAPDSHTGNEASVHHASSCNGLDDTEPG